MKKFTKITAFCMAALMAVSMTACSSAKTLNSIKKTGKLVMGTNAEFEPFEFKKDNKIVGIDVEISQKIAEKLGVELEIQDLAFDSLLVALQSGKLDIVAAGMTADEVRSKSVDFSDTYFNASQSIIVLKDSAITKPEDLNGKIVAVQLGTTGDEYCTDEKNVNPIKVAETKRMNKGVDAVMALLSGQADAVVIDNFPADKLVEANSDKIIKLDVALTEEAYAIALPKGSTELKKAVDEVLAEMKASGELDEISGKYISAE